MNDTTTSSSAAPRRRRKSRKGLAFAIAAVVAAGGAYGWYKYKDKANEEGEYIFGEVTVGDIEDLVTATGTLQPRDFVDVGAQVSGQIQQILVEVGDVVTKGQELVKIDAETSIARYDQSQVSLENAKNSLKSQEATLEQRERDFKRQENLLAADATTREAYLNAKTAYENQVRSVEGQKLSIKQQELSIRIENKNLGFTTIVAPIDGTVMSIAVKIGQAVNASQSVPNVMRIANLNTMTVQAEVSEADVSKLYDGIPVYFTTLNSPRRWQGSLRRVEPTPKVQNSVVLYNALFDVQNEGDALRPSMTAQVFFVSAEARNVLMVPMAALQQGQQIAREMAAKEREKNGGEAGRPGAPGSAGAGAAPGAMAATREGAAAPALAVATAPATGEGAPAAAAGQQPNRQAANAEGNRPGAGGQRMREGQAGAGGQRPGGGMGNRQGGFDPQNMTPEQRERLAAMRAGGGGFGGQRAGGGGFGGQRGGGGFNGPRPGGSMMGSMGGSGPSRAVQQRRGTVMVKKADGALEPRQVVVGVTDRVQGQVISGLQEGEEVVIGKTDPQGAASSPRPNQNNNNNQGNRGNQNFGGGGFPGGGRGF